MLLAAAIVFTYAAIHYAMIRFTIDIAALLRFCRHATLLIIFATACAARARAE